MDLCIPEVLNIDVEGSVGDSEISLERKKISNFKEVYSIQRPKQIYEILRVGIRAALNLTLPLTPAACLHHRTPCSRH